MEDENSDGGSSFAAFFMGGALGLMVGVAGTYTYLDGHRVERAATEEHTQIVLGHGQRLKAPGVSVLIGPASTEEVGGINAVYGRATMPIYAEQNDGGYALSCLVLDKQKQLVAGGSVDIPPKLAGADLNVRYARHVDGGTVQCSLIKGKAPGDTVFDEAGGSVRLPQGFLDLSQRRATK